MRPLRNKFIPLPDDLNPRKARKRTPNPIRTLKTWTIKAQVVKAMELSSPTTTRTLLKALIDSHAVSDGLKGMSSVRRAITALQKHGIIIVDHSITHQNSPDYGFETLLYLNQDRKYRFI